MIDGSASKDSEAQKSYMLSWSSLNHMHIPKILSCPYLAADPQSLFCVSKYVELRSGFYVFREDFSQTYLNVFVYIKKKTKKYANGASMLHAERCRTGFYFFHGNNMT